MIIENWFSTPILSSTLDPETANRIKADFFSKEDKVKSLLEGGTWGDNITTSVNAELDFVSRLELKELGDIMDTAVNAMAKAFGIEKTLIRTESWVNYQNKYQYQNKHRHDWHDVSACYYVQATPDDGAFRAYPENEGMGIWCKNHAMEAMHTVVYKPTTGLLLAFPSWMQHSSSQNMTDNTRISIAFNYNFENQK